MNKQAEETLAKTLVLMMANITDADTKLTVLLDGAEITIAVIEALTDRVEKLEQQVKNYQGHWRQWTAGLKNINRYNRIYV